MKALGRVFLFMIVCGSVLHAQNSGTQRMPQLPPAKAVTNVQRASVLQTPQRTEGTLSDSARLEWVRHISSNSSSSMDIATDVAIDAGGCVYMTGKSESAEAGRNYLTIKYDTHGIELWRAQYDGPSHGDDVPVAIAIDASGNTYVTGMSMGIDLLPSGDSHSYDYATIKYNSTGQELWVTRYKNCSGGTDAAAAIAVDAAGNVYVTGESDHGDSTIGWWSRNADFATIKYDPNGLQQWVARYDGSRSGQVDRARALALDDAGDVFVTGVSESYHYEFHSEIVTIKYDPSGMQQWVAERGLDSMNAEPVGIAVDNSGGVYIAGQTRRHGVSIFTTKYSANGSTQWLRLFNDSLINYSRANSLMVDRSGNVTVVGIEGPEVLYRNQGTFAVTLQYNTLGDLLWSRTYSESDNAILRVAGHGVDAVGNIYVAASTGWGTNLPDLLGKTILAFKYDANGNTQWVQRFDGGTNLNNLATAIAVNQSGTIAVAGGSGPKDASDFVAIKYQSSGTKLWDTKATGEGSSFESLTAMTLDAAGNVYVTGSSLSANASYDYFTAKFNPNGDQFWKAEYNGPANGPDNSNAIAVDAFGNVYVTGSSQGVGTSNDWMTIKYSSAGIEQWAARYNGVTNQNDEALLITVDSALNVYVVGATDLSSRMTTIKYSSSGRQQWAASYDSTGFVAMPGGLRVDKNGNVYVTNPQWYWADAIAFKYNSLGNEVWRVPGGYDIQVDDSANVYVSGTWYSSWTKKYNSSGALLWNVGVGGTRIEFDHVGELLFHNFNQVPAYSGKINKGGAIRWIRTDSQTEWAFGFCVDGVGNSFVSGYEYWGAPPSSHSAKISPTGSVQWLTEYSANNSLFMVQACQVDASGNLYVAGISTNDDFSNSVTILKYGQVTVSVKENKFELPLSYSLFQNFPNPFNPSTTIQFALPKSGPVELKVYNTLGQEVATLANEEKIAGTYSAQWNAGSVSSGVYFYRLKAGEYSETKKLLLLR